MRLQINVAYANCLISLISGLLKFKSPSSSSTLIEYFILVFHGTQYAPLHPLAHEALQCFACKRQQTKKQN